MCGRVKMRASRPPGMLTSKAAGSAENVIGVSPANSPIHLHRQPGRLNVDFVGALFEDAGVVAEVGNSDLGSEARAFEDVSRAQSDEV